MIRLYDNLEECGLMIQKNQAYIKDNVAYSPEKAVIQYCQDEGTRLDFVFQEVCHMYAQDQSVRNERLVCAVAAAFVYVHREQNL